MAKHGRARKGRIAALGSVRSGRLSSALLALWMVIGCTAVAGLDKDYVQAEQPLAGAAGQTAGNGGRSGSGAGGIAGIAGTAGAGLRDSGTGATDSGRPETGPPTCAELGCPNPEEKCCGVPSGADAGVDPNERQCVGPSPTFGCSAGSCAKCFFPVHGVPICRGEQCGVQCNPGYVEQAGDCVPDGTGGNGGSSGQGGQSGAAGQGGSSGAPQCNPRTCPTCSFVGPFGCCRQDGSCGCTWFPVYCF
ncbi:MAG TPA: hypothetical protein VK524_01480 [Polyangiaceae bacterium]|nr:hypothetical protein [Polyangiaceae bacterium]